MHDGAALANATYDARKADQDGHLHAGNSGATISGKHIGECPRLPVLRALGISEAIDFTTSLIFGLGHGSEAQTRKVITEAWEAQPDCIVFPDEAIKAQWAVASGRPVHCTPDIVLGRTTGGAVEIVEVVEHKAVTSVWAAISAILKRQPKTPALCQLAHYTWQLGAPGTLLYVNRNTFHIGPKCNGQNYVHLNLERACSPSHPALRYDRNGELMGVGPCHQAYQCEWRGDTFWYRPEGDTWVETYITTQSIRDFYSYVDECIRERKVPEKFTQLTATGERDSFNKCQYCAFADECRQHSGNWDDWTQSCKAKAEATVVDPADTQEVE